MCTFQSKRLGQTALQKKVDQFTAPDINRHLSGVETILLYAEPQFSSISSTRVRELQHFGVDVTPYLPKR